MASGVAFSYRSARSPAITSAIDLPTPGTNEGRDYVHLTKPGAPNVLIVLDAPRRVRLTAGLHREVRRIAPRLDDPDAFLRAVEEHRAALAARSA